MDESTRLAVEGAAQQELEALLTWLVPAPPLDLAVPETTTRERLPAVGARLLEAGWAARGPGKAAPRRPCPGGGQATGEGYRAKGVQILVGWITGRRADSWGPQGGQGQGRLDGWLGLGRYSHSPRVRRVASRFGALLPLSQAAATLGEAARGRVSARTGRVGIEAVGDGRGAG